jgi:RNA polymerase sigma-70 factor (ECF subfamily)
MSDTDEALVRRAQAGDRPGLEELVRRTSRLVFARLYLETGDTQRAEDLLQETFLVAFRSIGQLAEPKGFRSWLFTIAQNVAIDAGRRQSRLKRTVPPRTDVATPDAAPSPVEELERQEARGRVLSILRSMPEEYRLPLMLRYLGGADYGTIGMQLGLSNGSLRGLLHRGLELLRGELKRSATTDVPQ